MNIAGSLKERNRIVGKINKLQSQIQKNNRYEAGQQRDFDSSELLVELEIQKAYLIDLKTKIARANVGICDKLIQLAEAKADLVFWEGMERYSGAKKSTESRSKRVRGEYEDVDIETFHSITSKEVAENQERCQKLIENLQDDIDNFNATTKI